MRATETPNRAIGESGHHSQAVIAFVVVFIRFEIGEVILLEAQAFFSCLRTLRTPLSRSRFFGILPTSLKRHRKLDLLAGGPSRDEPLELLRLSLVCPLLPLQLLLRSSSRAYASTNGRRRGGSPLDVRVVHSGLTVLVRRCNIGVEHVVHVDYTSPHLGKEGSAIGEIVVVFLAAGLVLAVGERPAAEVTIPAPRMRSPGLASRTRLALECLFRLFRRWFGLRDMCSASASWRRS